MKENTHGWRLQELPTVAGLYWNTVACQGYGTPKLLLFNVEDRLDGSKLLRSYTLQHGFVTQAVQIPTEKFWVPRGTTARHNLCGSYFHGPVQLPEWPTEAQYGEGHKLPPEPGLYFRLSCGYINLYLVTILRHHVSKKTTKDKAYALSLPDMEWKTVEEVSGVHWIGPFAIDVPELNPSGTNKWRD